MIKKIDFILNVIGISFMICWIVIDLIKHHDPISIISWLVIALALSFADNWRQYKQIEKLKNKNSHVYFTENGVMVSTDGEHWKYGYNNIKKYNTGNSIEWQQKFIGDNVAVDTDGRHYHITQIDKEGEYDEVLIGIDAAKELYEFFNEKLQKGGAVWILKK
ncbi:hypothetical protein [Clostridium sp. HBUAS56017]|uniref:hypothetical protein n=1 Tax=Clostridium sp. HBUAS56017 TaxID=2571128 RepID=UPI0011775585|nr:hypothetical protein [Clostridium sp. HBUAS56017]